MRPGPHLFVVALLPFFAIAHAQDATRSPASWVPGSVDLYVEVDDPVVRLDAALAAPWVGAVRTADYAGEIGANGELRRAHDLLRALAPGLAGRVGIGVRRREGLPWIILVSENGRGLDLEQVAALLVKGLGEVAIAPRETVRGAEWRDVAGLGHIAARDGFLFWSNHRFLLRRGLGIKRDASVAADPRFREAARAGAHVTATARVAAWSKDGFDADENFVATLLFRGLADDLAHAEHAALTATLHPWPELNLELSGAARSPSWSSAARSYHQLPHPARLAAALRIDRDLASFWRARHEVVPEGGRQELAEFEQGMNTFFSGFPFSEVMDHLEPGAELYIGRNDFDEQAAPELRLPGFALVFETRFTPDLEDRFRVAFQTAVGVVNATAAEERRQPMLLVTRDFDGVLAQGARFLSDPRDGRSGTEYNFTPSVALVGRRLVLATSLTLIGDLVPALSSAIAATTTTTTTECGDRLRLHGPAIAAALRDNLDVLTEQRVLEEGQDEDEARRTVEGFIAAIGAIGNLTLSHEDRESSSSWRLALAGADREER